MSQNQNFFVADLREIQFVLFEQFGMAELLSSKLYSKSFDESGARMVLSEAHKFASEVLGPLNSVGDQAGCKLENGKVETPPGFKEAWVKLFEAGLRTTSTSAEWGGMGAPKLLAASVEEFLCGANVAFNMYPGLAMGAAEVIEQFGTHEQKERYLHRMYSGEWGGTWPARSYLYMYIGNVVENGDVLPYNNADTRIVGIYWNVGVGNIP